MVRVDVVNKLSELTTLTTVASFSAALLVIAYIVFFARETSQKVNGGFWLLGVWGFYCTSRFILPICGVDYDSGIDVVSFNKTAEPGSEMTVGYPNLFMGFSAVVFLLTVAGNYIKEAYQENGLSTVSAGRRQSPSAQRPPPLQEITPITPNSEPKVELEPVQTPTVGALKAIRKIQLD